MVILLWRYIPGSSYGNSSTSMHTEYIKDTLKGVDNLLDIDLDTRKSSFVQEVADNLCDSGFLEPISTHCIDKYVYLIKGS